jgi:hypothetical protein
MSTLTEKFRQEKVIRVLQGWDCVGFMAIHKRENSGENCELHRKVTDAAFIQKAFLVRLDSRSKINRSLQVKSIKLTIYIKCHSSRRSTAHVVLPVYLSFEASTTADLHRPVSTVCTN